MVRNRRCPSLWRNIPCSRLVRCPPGSVGYEEGGYSEAVRRRLIPSSCWMKWKKRTRMCPTFSAGTRRRCVTPTAREYVRLSVIRIVIMTFEPRFRSDQERYRRAGLRTYEGLVLGVVSQNFSSGVHQPNRRKCWSFPPSAGRETYCLYCPEPAAASVINVWNSADMKCNVPMKALKLPERHVTNPVNGARPIETC